ncbi:MAG: hypothetical protein KDC95_09780 [Planctomycetes bacterium]|nr:hypothetical protein [Planctomycetota bacterium]
MAAKQKRTLEAVIEGKDRSQRAFDSAIHNSRKFKSRVTNDFGAIGKKLLTVGAAVSAIGIALAGVASVRAFGGVLDEIDELNKAARRLALPIDDLIALRTASELSGLSANETAQAWENFSKKLAEAAQGNNTVARTYAALGVEVKNQDGSLRNQLEVLEDLSDAYSKLPQNQLRVQAAANLFGKRSAKLATLLEGGADSFRELVEQGRFFNGVIGSEGAKRAEDFNDALLRLKVTTKSFFREGLLTYAKEVTPAFNALATVLAENRDDVVGFFATGASAAAAFTETAVGGLASIVGAVNSFAQVWEGARRPFETVDEAVARSEAAIQNLGRAVEDIDAKIAAALSGKQFDLAETLEKNGASIRRRLAEYQTHLDRLTLKGKLDDELASLRERFDQLKERFRDGFQLEIEGTEKASSVFEDLIKKRNELFAPTTIPLFDASVLIPSDGEGPEGAIREIERRILAAQADGERARDLQRQDAIEREIETIRSQFPAVEGVYEATERLKTALQDKYARERESRLDEELAKQRAAVEQFQQQTRDLALRRAVDGSASRIEKLERERDAEIDLITRAAGESRRARLDAEREALAIEKRSFESLRSLRERHVDAQLDLLREQLDKEIEETRARGAELELAEEDIQARILEVQAKYVAERKNLRDDELADAVQKARDFADRQRKILDDEDSLKFGSLIEAANDAGAAVRSGIVDSLSEVVNEGRRAKSAMADFFSNLSKYLSRLAIELAVVEGVKALFSIFTGGAPIPVPGGVGPPVPSGFKFTNGTTGSSRSTLGGGGSFPRTLGSNLGRSPSTSSSTSSGDRVVLELNVSQSNSYSGGSGGGGDSESAWRRHLANNTALLARAVVKELRRSPEFRNIVRRT